MVLEELFKLALDWVHVYWVGADGAGRGDVAMCISKQQMPEQGLRCVEPFSNLGWKHGETLQDSVQRAK